MDWIIDYDLTAVREVTPDEALAEYGDTCVVYGLMARPTQLLAVPGPRGEEAVLLFRSPEEITSYQAIQPRPFPTDNAGEFELRYVLGTYDAALLIERDGVSWKYTGIVPELETEQNG